MQLPTAVLLLWSLRCAAWASAEEPLVRVESGVLRGRRVERPPDSPLRTLYAFEGIPFARPPLGDLRFKDPEEAEAWTGIRNATAYGPKCIQKKRTSGVVSGEEDCLYLNVFTSRLSNKTKERAIEHANVFLEKIERVTRGRGASVNVKVCQSNNTRCTAQLTPGNSVSSKQPVLVFIHGGAFIQWSGNLEHIRADPILRKGIVFVTMNYRLGVMGFLNTEDSQAPGNAGLKDQTMALRWVQRNVAAFGGDPNKVTIMGESAGGASVHYHLLSPLSRGLFHGAISVSGSALPAWARVQRPREQALALRRRFAGACPQLPEEDIVSCLRQVDAQELVLNQDDLPRGPYQRYILKNMFLPSVETASSSNSPFLTTEPEQLMKEGNFTQVPYMTGFTNGEGIMILHFMNLLSDPSAWAEVDEHFEAIFRWELPPGHRTPEGARQLRRFYLGDRSLRDAHLNNDTLQKFLQLCTDTFFASGTATSARLMADHGAPVYVYQFSRDGPIAFLKNLVYKATHIPGVMHGDDMAYVFDFIVRDSGEPRPVPSSERPLRERQVQFIEQFVKYGRPTPEENGVVHWPLFTSVNETYLDINRELSTNQPVLEDRANFWRRLVTENVSVEDSTRQLNSRKR